MKAPCAESSREVYCIGESTCKYRDSRLFLEVVNHEQAPRGKSTLVLCAQWPCLQLFQRITRLGIQKSLKCLRGHPYREKLQPSQRISNLYLEDKNYAANGTPGCNRTGPRIRKRVKLPKWSLLSVCPSYHSGCADQRRL